MGIPIAIIASLFNYILPFKVSEKISFLPRLKETW